MAVVPNGSGSGTLDRSIDNSNYDITPSDTAYLPVPVQALFITVGGDVTYVNVRGETVVQTFVAGGPYFVGTITRIMSTGTTATGIKGVASKGLR